MKVIIAPDKFKGALSAAEVASNLQIGFSTVWPDAEFLACPVADGGEGTADALQQALNGRWISVRVHDPLGRQIDANYCQATQNGESIAIMEMSEASGMRRVAAADRNPLRSSTRGVGELIRSAALAGAKKIIVGLGGSATNDGGAGMASVFGYRFLDSNGNELAPVPESIAALARIVPPPTLDLPQIIAAVDVQNPFLGDKGATYTYGPQKGAGPKELAFLESVMGRLADVAESALGRSCREIPGTGAAGGLGFGLAAFCNAEIRHGFGIVAEALRLDDTIATANLVVTAEGSMDAQTLHGKAPAGVANLARKHGKPVIAFAGSLSDEEQLAHLFDGICPLAPRPMTLQESMEQTASLLQSAAARAARLINTGKRSET